MNTNKIGIRNLAEICEKQGIRYAVISPGSRNAPLTAAFLAQKTIECISIVDERSAAFFALGIAQQTNTPVALICTSGSAVLNYAPAIAEAFYQKIPLLVLTADRPNEWIDQGENQSIHQYRIYQNYIKKSFELPVEPATEKDIWYSDRVISEAINTAKFPEPGPVHINIPLREPLYDLNDAPNPFPPKIIETVGYQPSLDEDALARLINKWRSATKKMIICGSESRELQLTDVLQELSEDSSIIILSESNSNIKIKDQIACIDRPIEVITKKQLEAFQPDIILTFGGGIVSKKIKFLYRSKNNIEHWHLTFSNEHWDTFQNLTYVINDHPKRFLSSLVQRDERPQTDFKSKWLKLDEELSLYHQQYLSTLNFCDFTTFAHLIQTFPANANIHFGNSTPIRYANLFDTKSIQQESQINANRGVSGIDGVTSTAAGAAYVNKDKLTICITGDLAFFYDSNALWNHYIKSNFKIIVINNGGGNIFRIIPGPDKMDQFEEFTETKHTASIELLTKTFGIAYYFCDSMDSLEKVIPAFYKFDQTAAVLEIKTDAMYSADALKNYFTYITNQYEQQRMAND
jgi:2-succinyl-5-enolpyruvyl-6-hydroxy-3-cyclohexene-1-carboxylate synthase